MKLHDLKNNKKIIMVIKIFFCFIVIINMLNFIKNNVIASYQGEKNYNYRNDFENVESHENVEEIVQEFVMTGTNLSNIELYFSDDIGEDILEISILDKNDIEISSKQFDEKEFCSGAWNSIGVDLKNLKSGATYLVKICGKDLSAICISATDSMPEIFGKCKVNGNIISGVLALGVQSSKLEIVDKIGFVIQIFLILILSIITFYVIIFWERIYKIYSLSHEKGVWLYALYFSLLTVFCMNPIAESQIKLIEFKRIIGQGINDGIDVSKRISNFNQWFLLLVISFGIFYLFFNYVRNNSKTEEQVKMMRCMDNVIVLSNVLLGIRSFSFFSNNNKMTEWLTYSDFMLLAVIVIGNIYILFHMDDKIKCEDLFVTLLFCWLLSYPVAICATSNWRDGKSLLAIQYMLFIATTLMFIVTRNALKYKKWIDFQKILVLFFAFIPFMLSLYIELIVILNQHEIFVAPVKKYFLLFLVAWIFVSALITSVFCAKHKKIKNWKKLVYPIIIIGVFCLWKQAQISGVYNADIFESANSSVLISDFFNFGDIPIVQHYGGHMMSGVWEGILYGILNNDVQGAIFSPYAEYVAVLVAVLFYYLLNVVWDENMAFLITLTFPFYENVSYWGLGIFACLTMVLYVKKNTYIRAAFFWFSLIWCALYRLDLGFAFLVASVISMFIYIIIDKNIKACKQLILTLLAWGCIGGFVWFGVCIFKKLNPINRLKEFILLSMSNQDWAYSTIGDSTLASFSWAYIFIPFLVAILLLKLFFMKKNMIGREKEIWIVTLALGLAYIFNFSRGLVRHSLAEGILTITMWTAPVFLAVVIGYMKHDNRWMVPSLALLMVLNGLMLTNGTFVEKSALDAGVVRLGNYIETWQVVDGKQNYWDQLRTNKEKIKRVEYSEDLRDTVDDYGFLINSLLDDDETYIDFMNRTFLYSALKRRDPVYVSQSPLQLSGEYTQSQFINQIKGVPLVLMPYDKQNCSMSEELDGIANIYRYYKVSEFIYQNYVPLCVYEDKYALWCLPEKYDSMVAIIETYQNQGEDIKNSLLDKDKLIYESVAVKKQKSGAVSVTSVGHDPKITELQNVINLTPYIGNKINFKLEYESENAGKVQIFYTTENRENYTEDKSILLDVQGAGTISFNIPITEFTRIRMDVPDGNRLEIKSFKVDTVDCKSVQYGYDGPYLEGEQYTYLPSLHRYVISKLPVIWAEADEKKACDNQVVENLAKNADLFTYNYVPQKQDTNGNYMKVHIDYYGTDQEGKYAEDDEMTTASLILGKNYGDKFDTKFIYEFSVLEGQHDYLFRVSSDYYWYIGDTNAVKLVCNDKIYNVSISILEGD